MRRNEGEERAHLGAIEHERRHSRRVVEIHRRERWIQSGGEPQAVDAFARVWRQVPGDEEVFRLAHALAAVPLRVLEHSTEERGQRYRLALFARCLAPAQPFGHRRHHCALSAWTVAGEIGPGRWRLGLPVARGYAGFRASRGGRCRVQMPPLKAGGDLFFEVFGVKFMVVGGGRGTWHFLLLKGCAEAP